MKETSLQLIVAIEYGTAEFEIETVIGCLNVVGRWIYGCSQPFPEATIMRREEPAVRTGPFRAAGVF